MTVADPEWQSAAGWLWRQRKRAPANADVWDLRWRWLVRGEAERLYRTVKGGRWRLSPMQVCGRGKNAKAMWSAADALVLKWVALKVENWLPRPEACHHLKGKGVRHSLREVSEALCSGRYQFVHRTDNRYVPDLVCRAPSTCTTAWNPAGRYIRP